MLRIAACGTQSKGEFLKIKGVLEPRTLSANVSTGQQESGEGDNDTWVQYKA